jgi:hypothetical protein
MRPLLVHLSTAGPSATGAIREALAEQFGLTEQDLSETLPSGTTKRFVNTVAWALAHLRRAGAIESPSKGTYSITERGRQLVADSADAGGVVLDDLKRFAEYRRESSEPDVSTPEKGWERLIEQGLRSFSDPEFDEREREYKLGIAAAVREALTSEDDEMLTRLRRALGSSYSGTRYNLSNFRQHAWVLKAEGQARVELIGALRAFTDPGLSPIRRFERFDEVALRYADKTGSTTGSVLVVGSVLNFAMQPDELPPIKTTHFEFAEDLVGFPHPQGTNDEVYAGHLSFAQQARERFEEAELPIRDMLDVQSILWEASTSDRSQRRNRLRTRFERVLAEYPHARDHDQFGSQHPLWRAFEEASTTIAEIDAIADRDTLRPKFSIGQGNWARVPWLAILDSRDTDSTQHGVYPVFLFRADGTGFYLTIGQGVTVLKREMGAVGAYEELQARAKRIREWCDPLLDRGFQLDGEIDLRSEAGLGRDYEASIAGHKFYEAGQVPDDASLIADLTAVIDSYSAYLEGFQSASLDELVKEWREESGYPSEDDLIRRGRREEVASRLREELLRDAEDNPGAFEEIGFGRFAHGGYYGSPGPMSTVNQALKESDDNKIRMARSLRHLLYGEAPVGKRIDDVIADDEFKVPGFGEALAVKALAVTDPDRWIPIYPYAGGKGKESVLETPELGAGGLAKLEGLSVGERAVRSNDILRQLVEPVIPDDPWGQMQFLYWLRDRRIAAITPTDAPLAPLAERLLLPERWLQGVAGLLRQKRQVIFRGPPGTGKTFVARELAHHLAGDRSRVRLVQFHASYAYEDFVQGYRPTLAGDTPGFELRDGPLVELAQKAAADRDHTYVLIIDELNRGNVAKVFGELYFLLEYRGESVRLQYGSGPASEDFSLPDNLWFIGTMNTADQSIALLDSALRRRFFFVDFYPTEPPLDRLLMRWLQAKGLAELDWLPAVVEEVNRRLDDRETSLGQATSWMAITN